MNFLIIEFRFGRKNMIVQPGRKWHIVGQSAKTCHGRMGVRINKARHDDTTTSIDDARLRSRDKFIPLTYPDDLIPGNGHGSI